jgi:hypothetical protein
MPPKKGRSFGRLDAFPDLFIPIKPKVLARLVTRPRR